MFEYLYGKLKREQFKPPGLLDDFIGRGRYGLKSQGGFYDYEGGAAETLKRERDRKLYARRRLFLEEQKRSGSN